ncbi:MAG: hypothetical protein ACRCU2_07005, partial [Planktothrix sp.]
MMFYSRPKSVVEDPHPQPLSQNGRGEKTDVINHLGLLYSKWVGKWLKPIATQGMSVMVLTSTWIASFSLPASTASIQLFILAGQSNMVGYRSNLDDLPPDLQQP